VPPLKKLGEPPSDPVSCAEEHEIMFEKPLPKIDEVCAFLLARFLVGLAGYSVVIQFLK
jgi:hypothetical protein